MPENKKLCPLRKETVQDKDDFGDIYTVENFLTCLGEKCGWFDVNGGMCAILKLTDIALAIS